MYSKKEHPDLAFCLFNGIVLEREIHKKYHKYCGVNSTASQFIQFLKSYNNLCLTNSQLIKVDSNRLESLIQWVGYLDQKILQVKK